MATPALSGKSHRSYVLSDSKVLYAAEAEESIIIPSDARPFLRSSATRRRVNPAAASVPS